MRNHYPDKALLNKVYKICRKVLRNHAVNNIGICIVIASESADRRISKEERRTFLEHFGQQIPTPYRYASFYHHPTFNEKHANTGGYWWVYGETDGKGKILYGSHERLRFVEMMIERTEPTLLEFIYYRLIFLWRFIKNPLS